MSYRVSAERDLPPNVRAALERQEAEAEYAPGILTSVEDWAACEQLAASTGLSVREVQWAILTRIRDHALGEEATSLLVRQGSATPEPPARVGGGFRAGFQVAFLALSLAVVVQAIWYAVL